MEPADFIKDGAYKKTRQGKEKNYIHNFEKGLDCIRKYSQVFKDQILILLYMNQRNICYKLSIRNPTLGYTERLHNKFDVVSICVNR